MLRRFDGDDQRVADLFGAGGAVAGFARVVVDVEDRVLEGAAAHVLRTVQDCFPFAHVGASFFLGRVFLHVEEALGVGVGLAILDLLVAGAEYDLQARARVRSGILRIRRRGIAEGCLEADAALQAAGRRRQRGAQIFAWLQLSLVDHARHAFRTGDDAHQVFRHLAPANLELVVRRCVRGVDQQRLDRKRRQLRPKDGANANRAAQQIRRGKAGAQLRRQRGLLAGRNHMEIVARIAAERHEVRLDDTRTAAGADCAIWRARPVRFGVVGGTDSQRIDTVRRYLHTGVAGCAVHLAVVADGDGHQSVAVAQQVVDDRRPGMHVGILDRQVRAETEVDELVLPGEQDLLDETQGPVQLQRIFSLSILVQHAQVIDIGKRAGGSAIRLDGTEQERGTHGQAMLKARRIVLRVFI